MGSRKDEAVAFWAPHFREIRAQKGLDAKQYPLAVCLAFVDIESDGDPHARRTNKDGRLSKYVGLLQIGTENAADSAIPEGWSTRRDDKFGVIWNHYELEDMEPVAAGRRSIEHFFYYMERYRRIHEYEPELMALLWKGGPGYTRGYKRALAQSEAKAAQYVKTKWGGTAEKYLGYFRRDYPYWRDKDLENNATATAATFTLLTDPANAAAQGTAQGARQAASTAVGNVAAGTVKRNRLGKIIVPAGSNAPAGCTGVTESRTPLRSPGASGAVAGDASRATNAAALQQVKRDALSFLERSFYDSLRVYQEGAYVRWRANNGFNEYDYKQISAFVAGADGHAYARTLTAVFRDAVVGWVKPLVNPVVGNSPWGKKRNFPARARSRGEARQLLRDPETNEILYRRHFGVDYATLRNGLGKNQPCYAIADGEVIRAGESLSYGLVIYLLHANGVTSRYAHLREIHVKKGEKVKAAQQIGVTGASEGERYGNRPGFEVVHDKLKSPHLHFELRINTGVFERGRERGGYFANETNISIDPEPIFSVCPNPGEARPTIDPRLEAALGLRSKASALVASAKSSEMFLEASRVYDEASGMTRDMGLALVGRGAFWEAHSQNKDRDVRKQTKFDAPVE